MRQIPAGFEARFEVVVTAAMTVDFEDKGDPRLGKLHPVYATYWLVKEVEPLRRPLILPFLEEGEEGIGHAVEVRHLASALPGMRVLLTATLERQEGNRVHAACRAVSELGDVIGEGATVQVVLPEAQLQRAFARLRERWAEARAAARGPYPKGTEAER